MKKMQWFSFLLLCVLVLTFVSAKSVKKLSPKHKTKPLYGKNPSKALTIQQNTHALRYLTQFGYNPCENSAGSKPSSHNGPSCISSMESMLENFQTKFHLPVTKKLDDATFKVMNTSRCGMPDSPPSLMDRSYLW
jgi:hypothetical protein